MRRRNLTKEGDVYERLTVVSFKGANKQGRLTWECLCECGNMTIVTGTKLRRGEVRSCGCLARENASRRATTHGGSNTITYSSWVAMMHRCNNPNRNDYKDYGGRGIEVCDMWLDYPNFLSDMGARPSKQYTLERIDNNGNYTPENCRWVTRKEQSNNTRRNLWVTHNGVTNTLAQWANQLGIPYTTLQWRLHAGWPDSEILNGR